MTPQIDTTGELYCPTCERMFANTASCPTDGSPLVSLMAQPDPFVGRDLDGRYQVGDKLGHGGMGAVYRGTQLMIGRPVAIKVVQPAIMSSPDVIKRFLREAKLASRINHPNAVSVLDFGQTTDGVFYLVMELLAGSTLEAIVEAEGALAADRVVAIGAQVLSALECAHAVPIVHRDLKPANIIVGPQGLVKVLDFGIAKSLSPEIGSTTMTGAGMLVGTPSFIAPELAAEGQCDGRADLYSLGCILYQLATGRLPFTGTSIHELLHLHMSVPPPPMPEAPRALAAVIERMLAKAPSDRHASARDAREALEATLGPAPAVAVPSPTLAIGAPPRRSRRLWLWGGAAVAAAIAGTIIILASLGTSATPTPAPTITPPAPAPPAATPPPPETLAPITEPPPPAPPVQPPAAEHKPQHPRPARPAHPTKSATTPTQPDADPPPPF